MRGPKAHIANAGSSSAAVTTPPEWIVAPRTSPACQTTVAGLRTTQMSINGDAVVITNKGSGAWRELLSGAGVRSVSVSGAGVFTGSTAEARIKTNALTGILDDYELSFESGERLRARFLVTRLDYAGDFNGERTYTLALESSGALVSL